jgi:hypothetical protein
MHTVRTFDGSLRDMLDPSHSIVPFEDDGTIIPVSTHLPYAWTAFPPLDEPTTDSVIKFIKVNHDLNDEKGRSLVPQNLDKDTIHTPWRDEI